MISNVFLFLQFGSFQVRYKLGRNPANCRKSQLLNCNLQAQRGLKPMQLAEETVEQRPQYAAEPMSSNTPGLLWNVQFQREDGCLTVSNSTQYSLWILTGKGLPVFVTWRVCLQCKQVKPVKHEKNCHILVGATSQILGRFCTSEWFLADGVCGAQDQTVPKYITVSIPWRKSLGFLFYIIYILIFIFIWFYIVYPETSAWDRLHAQSPCSLLSCCGCSRLRLGKKLKAKQRLRTSYNIIQRNAFFEFDWFDCSGNREIMKHLDEPGPLQHLQWGAGFMASICAVSFNFQKTVTIKNKNEKRSFNAQIFYTTHLTVLTFWSVSLLKRTSNRLCSQNSRERSANNLCTLHANEVPSTTNPCDWNSHKKVAWQCTAPIFLVL